MAAHRQAFPTPRGATGGCPSDTVCGGHPRDPRGDGKSDPEGGVARLPDVVVRVQFRGYRPLVHRRDQMIRRAPWTLSLLQAIQVHHPNEAVH